MTHHDSVWRFRFTNRDQYYRVCCCTRVDVYKGEGGSARHPPAPPLVPTWKHDYNPARLPAVARRLHDVALTYLVYRTDYWQASRRTNFPLSPSCSLKFRILTTVCHRLLFRSGIYVSIPCSLYPNCKDMYLYNTRTIYVQVYIKLSSIFSNCADR